MAVTTNPALTGVSALAGLANPSASVGTSAVNGSASTAMRSDAAPALNLAISPTWTGNHTFAPASGNTNFTTGSVGIGGAASLGKLDMQGNFMALRDGSYQSFLGKASALHGGASASEMCFRFDDADLLFSVSGTIEAFRMTTTGRAKFGRGISADGGGVKHARVATGSVASAAAPLITITWATPFADANYTVAASVLEGSATSLSLRVAHVETITAEAVTVRLKNDAAGALSGTVHVIAVHD